MYHKTITVEGVGGINHKKHTEDELEGCSQQVAYNGVGLQESLPYLASFATNHEL